MAGTLTPALGTVRGARAAAEPTAALYVALHCDHPTRPPSRHFLADTDVVSLGRAAAQEARRRSRQLELSIADGWMSTRHALLKRVGGSWAIEDAGSRNGTRVNGAPCKSGILADGALIELGHTLFLFRENVPHLKGVPLDVDAARLAAPATGLATFSPPLAAEVSRLAAIARSTVPVVLHGATGSGKELAARALHQLSGRAGAFVAVNCGSIAKTLVETELFGYRKGAFSGAEEDRPGLMRTADKGTLFLDEIADLPASSQAVLLRALQESEVLPVGATKPVKVDVRVLAATHYDLPKLVEQGSFRADLFARISGFTVRLPPLSERREDLGLLTAEILRRVAPELIDRIALTPEAASALFAHGWPLNVRELEKCLSTAVVLAAGQPIDLPHLPDWAQQKKKEEAPARPASEAELRQREELVALLKEHHGNVSSIARALGKARMQVQRWLKRHGLEAGSFRG
jgi:DNA-binding NtrC family response regulator